MKNLNDISIRSNLQERDNLLTVDKILLTPKCKEQGDTPEQFQGEESSKISIEDAVKNNNVGKGSLEPPMLKSKSKSLRSIIECKIEAIPRATDKRKIKTSTFAKQVLKENFKGQAPNTKKEVQLPPNFTSQIEDTSKTNQKETIIQQEKLLTQNAIKQILQSAEESKHGDKIELSPIIMKREQESLLYFPIVELKEKLELNDFSPSRHFEENQQTSIDTKKKQKTPLKSRVPSRNKRSDSDYCESPEAMYDSKIVDNKVLDSRDSDEYEGIKEDNACWEFKYEKYYKKLIKYRKLYDCHFNSLKIVINK